MEELAIQVTIRKALNEAGYFCHSVPNEAMGRSRIGQAMLVSAGLVSGVADLIVWLGEGRVAYLEVKTAKGKQSEHQRTFERKCIAEGYPYRVCRSADEALRFIREVTENGTGN